jgi:hypothetical protein
LGALEIHLDAADAIQASQGFFSPVGSKRSNHSVDADSRLLHLCSRMDGKKQRTDERDSKESYSEPFGSHFATPLMISSLSMRLLAASLT